MGHMMTGPHFFAPIGFDDHLAPFIGSFATHSTVRPPPHRPVHRIVPNAHPIHISTPATVASSDSLPPYHTFSSPRANAQPPAALPSYQPFPQSAEAILLLAPPPTYCPCACDPESDAAHTRCQGRHSRTQDLVVLILIILNVLVWAAVVWGICFEWTTVTRSGYDDIGGVVFKPY